MTEKKKGPDTELREAFSRMSPKSAEDPLDQWRAGQQRSAREAKTEPSQRVRRRIGWATLIGIAVLIGSVGVLYSVWASRIPSQPIASSTTAATSAGAASSAAAAVSSAPSVVSAPTVAVAAVDASVDGAAEAAVAAAIPDAGPSKPDRHTGTAATKRDGAPGSTNTVTYSEPIY